MLTYDEVAATLDAQLPPGYRHVERQARIGTGDRAFHAAADALARWQPQRGAGFSVRTAAERARAGTPVTVGLGAGPLRVWAPCEVIYVIEEFDRYGWAYGTLPSHPVRGEEAFFVTRDLDGDVWFEVRAFSQPARWYVRLAGPLGRFLQRWCTARYMAAMRNVVR